MLKSFFFRCEPTWIPKVKFHFFSKLRTKDYYQVLNVPRNAKLKEIKKSYYRLSKKYHPDFNKNVPDAKVKFLRISEAYEVLKDKEKRKEYDLYLENDPIQTSSSPDLRQETGADRFNVDTEKVFKNIFKNIKLTPEIQEEIERQQTFGHTTDGQDISKEFIITLSYLQAARGSEQQVPCNTIDICTHCGGKR